MEVRASDRLPIGSDVDTMPSGTNQSSKLSHHSVAQDCRSV